MSDTTKNSSSPSVQRRIELQATPLGRLERMIEIRLFEDRIVELFADGLVPGTTHTMQGQEAIPVGIAAATRPSDVVCCTYRGHGVALALGVQTESVLGEILGRQIGCMGGLGGSMHLSDPDVNLLPTFAIVGAGIPIAIGAALTFATTKSDNVALSVFGDGATNIGAFHEGLNLAKVWNLPAIFICENNLYGEYSPLATTTAVSDIADRARSFAMNSETVDGQDVDAVEATIARVVERARNGGGPTLVEAKTYRYSGHSRSDQGLYRPEGELEAWKSRDPIELFAKKLEANGGLGGHSLDEIRAQQRERFDDVQRRVLESPSATVSDMFTHVLAPNH
jgi:acetoin:2,6-dichlorophenolindophenol oxidoreductase subunit alpha